jgi:ubiquitin carboxyl-terminal hydrolase 12/46
VDEETLLGQLNLLFMSITASKKKTGVISTRRLMTKVRQLNSKPHSGQFEGDAHQDSHEFLIWLLNNLNDTLAKRAGKQRTWVADLFEGKVTTQTRCVVCETVTQREESFMDLSVDVTQNSSLVWCLKAFSSEETLNGADKFFCDVCVSKQQALKSVLIKQLPKLLVCHLKRFKYSEELMRYQKLGYRVAFPNQLRLPNRTRDCPDWMYDLFAVVIHVGQGVQYGHYVVVVKSHGHWIKFDDDLVDRVDERLIHSIFGSSQDTPQSPCGYLLFYRLIQT